MTIVAAATGPAEAKLLRDLMGYYVSDAVQTNLTSFDLMPIPHTEVRPTSRGTLSHGG